MILSLGIWEHRVFKVEVLDEYADQPCEVDTM